MNKNSNKINSLVSELNKEDKERIEITVKMQVKPSQALALEAFFEMWNSLASMGCSRNVSFFVDGDGDFKPKCEIAYSEKPKELQLPDDVIEYLKKRATVETNNGDYFFDYDVIASTLRSYKNKCFYKDVREIRKSNNDKTFQMKSGYYKGIYKEGVCKFPTLRWWAGGLEMKGAHFSAPYRFRESEGGEIHEIPIWARVIEDGEHNNFISVHLMKNELDKFLPYDWEMKEFISEDKFSP